MDAEYVTKRKMGVEERRKGMMVDGGGDEYDKLQWLYDARNPFRSICLLLYNTREQLLEICSICVFRDSRGNEFPRAKER